MITKLKVIENFNLEAAKEAVERFDSLQFDAFQKKYNIVNCWVDVNAAIELLRGKLKGDTSLENKVGSTKEEQNEEEEGELEVIDIEVEPEPKDFYRGWRELG